YRAVAQLVGRGTEGEDAVVAVRPTVSYNRLKEAGRFATNVNLPERQQTVHATIAWSYALLPELERALFRRLGVFRGGWSLEAAEAICADLFPLDALDGLSSLVEQSLLVVRDEGGEPRFGMLETIREYALEQLEAHDEGEALRQQHTRFFLEFVESAEPELTGAQQAFWMVALEAEHDNLRAALRWSLAHAPEGALRLSGALWRFWYGHTHLSEGRAWLEAAIARRDAIKASSAPYLAKALHGAGVLSMYQNDMAAAHVFLEEAQAIQREQGDSGQLAFVLHDLGGLAQCEAEYGQATALYEESLRLFRAVQNQWGIGVNLYRLGTVALAHNDVTRGEALLQGSLPIFRDLSDHGSMAAVMVSLGELAEAHEEYRRAADYAQAGLALYQEVGNKHGVSWALSVLGDVAELEGDSRRARSYYEEGVALAREAGSTLSIAAERGQLGCLAYDAGDYEHALAFAREELALVQNIGRKQTIIACLEAVAAAASGQGRATYAACVCGAMEGLRESIGNPRASTERVRYERGIARARRHSDEAVWAEAWAKGRAMSMAQAIAYALDPDAMIATSDGVPPT
ncbi:MAG: hypothetical protein H0X37_26410, partial [Herpetosiphonaceae bacterium]|nr:hypothetical protein [Herpetosiphonaceae bacterium]